MSDDPSGTHYVYAVLFALAAAGFALDRTRFGTRISGNVAIILGGVVLANVGILPASSSAYDAIGLFVVPLAIPLLLFDARLSAIIRQTGVTLGAFLLGAICTVAGALIAAAVLDAGAEEPGLAAMATATYVGGTMNLVAIFNTVGSRDETLLALVLASDNLVSIVYYTLLAAAPRWLLLQRWYGGRGTPGDVATVVPPATRLDQRGLCAAVAVAAAIAAGSAATAQWMQLPYVAVLLSTAASLAIANFAPRLASKLTGSFPLGMIIMYLYFAQLGVSVNLIDVVHHGGAVLLFLAMVVAVHALLMLALGRLLGLGLPELVIGSCSNIGGAPISAAIATGQGWPQLVTPGVLTGVLGLAIGNFAALAVAWVLGAL